MMENELKPCPFCGEEVPLVTERVPEYDPDEFFHHKQTNADRIRAMSDEELDKFLGDVQWDVANYCGGVTEKQEYPVPEQRGAWLDWLKQEVDNGDTD